MPKVAKIVRDPKERKATGEPKVCPPPEGKDFVTELVARCAHDPLKFVQAVWPWGDPETPLVKHSGPDAWQAQVLTTLGGGLNTKDKSGVQIAVASGHGIGKTALLAWIIMYWLATRPHPQVVVTANTSSQLTTKTWRELAKWHKRSLLKDWFVWTATKFYHRTHPETWCANAIPWSKERSEAFAGTHEDHVLYIFDEASAIDDVIWEVSEGAMTTPGAAWLAFGNPTRNQGRFFECFNKQKHRWMTMKVDSRTAKMADKRKLQEWIDDYGEDSDFVRVRVRGEFPRASTHQLIPSALVEEATKRSYRSDAYAWAPTILGVDVARHGDDQTIILARQGLMVHEIRKYRGLTVDEVVDRVIDAARYYKPMAICVDGVGLGAGVVDYLRKKGWDITMNVEASRKPSDPRYKNLRVELWNRVLEWLQAGGVVPNDQDLIDGLTAPEYEYGLDGKMVLESKKDMKARGLASPDEADALALTFDAQVPVGDVGRPKGQAEKDWLHLTGMDPDDDGLNVLDDLQGGTLWTF